MCSAWAFFSARAMYLAMCSLRVKTEPWPMGALGPRKAAALVSVSL